MVLGSSVFAFYLMSSAGLVPAEMTIGPVEATRIGIELLTPAPKLSNLVSRFRGKLLLFGSTVPAGKSISAIMT